MNNIIQSSVKLAAEKQLSLQFPEGYWWYTLEANETICAEMIFATHFLNEIDIDMEKGLARRILSCQRRDGTWALYYDGPPDLSTTIECYWALKLVSRHCDLSQNLGLAISKSLERSRDFILTSGGITQSRVFTKIHLAMFGLIPWSACPEMPAELMLMPTWAPINIYEFSSWARACIIPLLVVMQKKPVRKMDISLDELFSEPPSERKWNFKTDKHLLSWERFFIRLNKVLKAASNLPFRPFEDKALKKCDEWICEHISKTEDIFPALSYGAMALSILGHPNSHPIIRKSLKALKSFRQTYEGNELPAIARLNDLASVRSCESTIHQQCCISPVWDTPWQITALLEAGVPVDHPQLLKAGRWLIKKQVTEVYGDWKIKNPSAKPGGWSFEFENEYFPDVDDTIQVLHVLNRLAIPESEKGPAMEKGLKWLLSMQNDDGGFAAFDRNNDLKVVNKIPFSDHGACLDESSPDITARVLKLLSDLNPPQSLVGNVIETARSYLKRTQSDFGGWFGRWGINYIYGTWCVLSAIGNDTKAVQWLKSIQHADGGWSESPESYKENRYIPYSSSSKGVPSQTAWAVMGLIAAGEGGSKEVKRGIEFLTSRLKDDGTWDEREYTGTGFPGHFYIRYHGYRHFFPLLALAKALSDCNRR